MKYVGKIVKAGNTLHLTRYEMPVTSGIDDRRRNRKQDEEKPEWIRELAATKEKESEESIQKRSGLRARRKLMDLVRCNAAYDWRDHEGKPCTNKFLTLTFKENVTDLEYGNEEFVKFIKRLNYHVTGQKKAFLKYVAVVEFQQRGAVHYHVIFFNLRFTRVKEIAEVWGFGGVKINKIDHVDDLGAYLAKYMGKTFGGDDDDPDGGGSGKRRRDKGKKRYFVSRGLIKPEVIPVKTYEELDRMATSLAQNKVYEIELDSQYYGKITYRQYNMKRRNV